MLDATEIVTESTTEISRTLRGNMVFIHTGSYMMGSNKFYPEEKPVDKCPDGFWIDNANQ